MLNGRFTTTYPIENNSYMGIIYPVGNNYICDELLHNSIKSCNYPIGYNHTIEHWYKIYNHNN